MEYTLSWRLTSEGAAVASKSSPIPLKLTLRADGVLTSEAASDADASIPVKPRMPLRTDAGGCVVFSDASSTATVLSPEAACAGVSGKGASAGVRGRTGVPSSVVYSYKVPPSKSICPSGAMSASGPLLLIARKAAIGPDRLDNSSFASPSWLSSDTDLADVTSLLAASLTASSSNKDPCIKSLCSTWSTLTRVPRDLVGDTSVPRGEKSKSGSTSIDLLVAPRLE
mmetsp:Transcript_31584/g.73631  ORF Transcript_31584/g.73631 Transcript_31584/m.73631 type:complete len:226 (+) Transcript_31584:404-1081(+)